MTHQEIRQKFLKFFEERGHKIVPSSSLLPTDPSVLFTTAGMQQFKSYYTGEADPAKDFGSLNTASIQKCIRTSDIDSVGDESHLTFFEMFGNFSFGGYDKEKAIQLAYEFITSPDWMNLEIAYVTVFEGWKSSGLEMIRPDEESKEIWKKLGLKDWQIKTGGFENNFWGPTGDDGPCGPTTEIYVKGVEIWNIVFNEYYKSKYSDQYQPLQTRGIDTGMGLERLAMVVQNKDNIFEIDLFKPLLDQIKNKIPNPLNGEESYRIIADHLRASILLISEGLRPGKKERESVLRRLIRRATMHAILFPRNINNMQELGEVLTTKKNNFGDFTKILMDIYDYFEKIYPELKNKKENTEFVLYGEVKLFSSKIKVGEEQYLKFDKKISGKEVFLLKQSYGFPIELIRELAKRDGKKIDEAGLDREILEHQKISRAGAEKKFGGHGLILDTGELKAGNQEELEKVTRLHTATHLLHAALRKVLGNEVKQAGSDITAERLRFDFTTNRRTTEDELAKIEQIVNEAIKQDLPVTMQEMPYEEAIKKGALAFFKLKYPSVVKVYTIGPDDAPFSRELCGGPHVTHTGTIGNFRMIKEEAISSGVKRIRAVVE